jgi:hypothetical protein
MGEIRSSYKILVGKTEGKRPVRRRRCVWEDNIRMDVREVGLKVAYCMHLARDRHQWRALVDTIMTYSGSIKGGEFLD